jgi:glutathione synthase/RimK-type ligase-like ATP-grasp enzyme
MHQICFLSMDDLSGYVFDDELAVEPLEKLGWRVRTVSWRDQEADWNDFAAVIIRTTWDYQKYPAEFLRVLQKIDQSQARLENSLQTVEWNLSKAYLRDLEIKGIKIVPTVWGENSPTAKDFGAWLEHFKTGEIIVKPIVSATAEDTFRLKAFQPDLTEIFQNRRYLVQPFMPRIVTEGEFSLFYFGGKYSHTILKTPKEKDFRVQEEHGGIITAVTPSIKLLQTAERVFDLIAPVPLYARIDFVRNEDDEFCLMELELIEPALYLRMNENAPRFFAETIDGWLRQKVKVQR